MPPLAAGVCSCLDTPRYSSYRNVGFGPAPSDVGKLFDLENVYGQARALTIGVNSDRVGGNYLHVWSEDAANSAYVNVVQIMRNAT